MGLWPRGPPDPDREEEEERNTKKLKALTIPKAQSFVGCYPLPRKKTRVKETGNNNNNKYDTTDKQAEDDTAGIKVLGPVRRDLLATCGHMLPKHQHQHSAHELDILWWMLLPNQNRTCDQATALTLAAEHGSSAELLRSFGCLLCAFRSVSSSWSMQDADFGAPLNWDLRFICELHSTTRDAGSTHMLNTLIFATSPLCSCGEARKLPRSKTTRYPRPHSDSPRVVRIASATPTLREGHDALCCCTPSSPCR